VAKKGEKGGDGSTSKARGREGEGGKVASGAEVGRT